MEEGHPLRIKKLMLKIPDSYLGIGDKIIEDVELNDEGLQKLIHDTLETEFKDKKCIIMKFISPSPRYKVH